MKPDERTNKHVSRQTNTWMDNIQKCGLMSKQTCQTGGTILFLKVGFENHVGGQANEWMKLLIYKHNVKLYVWMDLINI